MHDDPSVRVLILGMGKSGTTALMTAVSQALGIPYKMEPKRLDGLNYRKTFVAKKLINNLTNHELKFILGFEKVIFLVRDPRDVLISMLMYRPYGMKVFAEDASLKQYLASIERKIADPSGVSLRNVIEKLRSITGFKSIETAVDLNDRLISIYKYYGRDAILVKYEDFIAGRTQDLEDYIGAPLPEIFQVPEKFGRVSRLGGAGGWKNWFTRADQIAFDALFARSYDVFGYAVEPLPAHQEIDRRASADYVRRIVDEWRARHGFPPYDPRFVELRRVCARMKKALGRKLRPSAKARKHKRRPKTQRAATGSPPERNQQN